MTPRDVTRSEERAHRDGVDTLGAVVLGHGAEHAAVPPGAGRSVTIRDYQEEQQVRTGFAALGCVGLGAGLMYVLDPDRGKRRRAALRDRAVHAASCSRHALDKTAHDLNHRVRGLVVARSARRATPPPTDDVLVERVRARLGRVAAYPPAIVVTATSGRVAVSGPILAYEVGPVLAAVRSVRGVRAVDNRLEEHERADDLPGPHDRLQQRARRLRPLQGHWSPTARLLALAAGGTLAGYGLFRRDRLGATVGALGIGLLLRGLTNIGLGRMVGVGVGQRAVTIEKTITVPIPVDQLYALWSQPENFPRFMAHVRSVRQVSGERSHWVVSGPAGLSVSWEAIVTQRLPNQLLAWQTVPGSLVSHAGTVRFERGGDSTRIDLRLRYDPPAGVLGHLLATLLRADPRHMLDDDLARFKSLLQLGKTHVRHEIVTRKELIG
jgi:uncharacterized membrane protein